MNVKDDHTISWSIQPHKKSINFGIFKHPGSHNTLAPKAPSSTFEPPPTPGIRPPDGTQEQSSGGNASSAAAEKLKAIGLQLVSWHGTCEANQISSGTYGVPKGEGGMYALVFDNTFAKQISKTATFVLMTYPTNSAPQVNNHTNHIQGSSSGNGTRTRSKPRLFSKQYDSSESVTQVIHNASDGPTPRGASFYQQCSDESSIASIDQYKGILQKRRRKRHQGYARRFFCLDYRTSTLSYYHNRSTQILRGSVPLSLAAIGANATTREISIDSGAEIWHLKAPNMKDFTAWKQALELACRLSSYQTPKENLHVDTDQSAFQPNQEEEREWAIAESLVAKLTSAHDTARRMARDTDPKYLSAETPSITATVSDNTNENLQLQHTSSAEASPTEIVVGQDYFQTAERLPFWKRKTSAGRGEPSVFKRSLSTQSSLSSPKSPLVPTRGLSRAPGYTNLQSFSEESIHETCIGLMKDLNLVVSEFNALISANRRRRMPPPTTTGSRLSLESQGSQEFFDADGGDESQILAIQHESEDESATIEQDFVIDDEDSTSSSEVDGVENLETTASGLLARPRSLAPLPLDPVLRRSTVTPPSVQPASLIGFLRKNVGKDFSTISMPVSANEPISLLQRASEQIEYSPLLDEAVESTNASQERLLYIAAFAVSMLSGNRIKERANRKPFNPLLGETFELVREDRGYRLLAEKVSHRPVQLAVQAEADHWTFLQSPLPTQKFWGKSAELITEGRIRVVLHDTGDRFSWSPVTCFLRNIIAGEKYVEPVGNMNVFNETTGEHAIVSFKSGGMFSGRSEEVSAQLHDSTGAATSLGLIGKWTTSLTVLENGVQRPHPIWKVGDVVPEAHKRYGFTSFAATLNEITVLEDGKMAPTDSRLRPDQRAVENGDFDGAELIKVQLEEAQRRRRKVQDEESQPWIPRWFTKVEAFEGEDVWKLKAGKDSYWEERAKGSWPQASPIFNV